MRAASAVYELLLGTALLFAPWSSLWQENWLFWRSGILEPYIMSGPVRGAVAGFGAAFVLSSITRWSRLLSFGLGRPHEGEGGPGS